LYPIFAYRSCPVPDTIPRLPKPVGGCCRPRRDRSQRLCPVTGDLSQTTDDVEAFELQPWPEPLPSTCLDCNCGRTMWSRSCDVCWTPPARYNVFLFILINNNNNNNKSEVTTEGGIEMRLLLLLLLLIIRQFIRRRNMTELRRDKGALTTHADDSRVSKAFIPVCVCVILSCLPAV